MGQSVEPLRRDGLAASLTGAVAPVLDGAQSCFDLGQGLLAAVGKSGADIVDLTLAGLDVVEVEPAGRLQTLTQLVEHGVIQRRESGNGLGQTHR